MTPAQIQELGTAFELGGHTMHHVVLSRTGDDQARQEIGSCRGWLEDITSQPCSMFCPPQGKYFPWHLHMIREAGFTGVRTVELLSVDLPRKRDGLMVMPTTLQAHPHGLSTYARNLAKRAAFRNLWLYIVHGRSTDWPVLARSLLDQVLERGGVFHLWGHSWELQESGQWQRLEDVLNVISQFTGRASFLTNSQVCRVTSSPG